MGDWKAMLSSHNNKKLVPSSVITDMPLKWGASDSVSVDSLIAFDQKKGKFLNCADWSESYPNILLTEYLCGTI